jgi:hypothetical protein
MEDASSETRERLKMRPVVPRVGSIVELGGFTYRVRSITKKDLILRPVGLTE